VVPDKSTPKRMAKEAEMVKSVLLKSVERDPPRRSPGRQRTGAAVPLAQRAQVQRATSRAEGEPDSPALRRMAEEAGVSTDAQTSLQTASAP
jgi:hypothetical protein